MSGTSRMDKKSLGGAKRRAYNCRKKGYAFPRGGCGHIRRGADPLDHLVKEAVLYRLDTPELGKLLTSDSADDGQLRELLQDRQAQQLRIDSLVDNYGSGLLTRPQLARAKGTAQAELQRLEADIDAQSRSRRVMNIPVGVRLREPGTTPRATSGDDS
jgi:site-specific DNA recombinase